MVARLIRAGASFFCYQLLPWQRRDGVRVVLLSTSGGLKECVLTQPIKHGREALKLYYRYLNIVSKREHKDIFLPSEDGPSYLKYMNFNQLIFWNILSIILHKWYLGIYTE